MTRYPERSSPSSSGADPRRDLCGGGSERGAGDARLAALATRGAAAAAAARAGERGRASSPAPVHAARGEQGARPGGARRGRDAELGDGRPDVTAEPAPGLSVCAPRVTRVM